MAQAAAPQNVINLGLDDLAVFHRYLAWRAHYLKKNKPRTEKALLDAYFKQHKPNNLKAWKRLYFYAGYVPKLSTTPETVSAEFDKIQTHDSNVFERLRSLPNLLAKLAASETGLVPALQKALYGQGDNFAPAITVLDDEVEINNWQRFFYGSNQKRKVKAGDAIGRVATTINGVTVKVFAEPAKPVTQAKSATFAAAQQQKFAACFAEIAATKPVHKPPRSAVSLLVTTAKTIGAVIAAFLVLGGSDPVQTSQAGAQATLYPTSESEFEEPKPYLLPATAAAAESFGELYGSVFTTPDLAVDAETYLFPIALARYTSGFGHRCIDLDGNGTRETCGHHDGYDLAAPQGTPIIAPARMRVTEVRTETNERGQIDGYGHYVTLREIDAEGNPVGLTWRFAHLCEQPDLAVGAELERGQAFACVGNSGRSTNSHLHWEVRDEETDEVIRLDYLLAFANYWQHFDGRARAYHAPMQEILSKYPRFDNGFIAQFVMANQRLEAFKAIERIQPRPQRTIVANVSPSMAQPALRRAG